MDINDNELWAASISTTALSLKTCCSFSKCLEHSVHARRMEVPILRARPFSESGGTHSCVNGAEAVGKSKDAKRAWHRRAVQETFSVPMQLRKTASNPGGAIKPKMVSCSNFLLAASAVAGLHVTFKVTD